MFNLMGRGGHGRVYETKENQVTKIGDIGPQEPECHQEAAQLGISPELISHEGNQLTMKKVQGETLLSKGEMTRKQYEQLKNKVEKAHKSRLFHNDLVAQNVMINDEGEPVLIDWGCGTTCWPDPERRDDIEQLDTIKKRYVK